MSSPFVQGIKAAKEPKADTDPDPTADPESEAEAQTESASASTSQTAAADLEEELLQNPPKGSADKLRVLRSRLKRLNNKIKEEPQVPCVSPALVACTRTQHGHTWYVTWYESKAQGRTAMVIPCCEQRAAILIAVQFGASQSKLAW